VRKLKGNRKCRDCKRKDTKYYYSRELSEFLKIHLWEGVYFCKWHWTETNNRWREQHGVDDEPSTSGGDSDEHNEPISPGIILDIIPEV
jgi:hypothetical protein